jgi:RNA polymerase sigma factor (sigma-70 family)
VHVFPTTIWTTIRAAAGRDREALERVAAEYRPPVLRFLRRRFSESDAEDLCQDVFLRILAGDVLRKVDPTKGRFRSLILAIATHVIQDRFRKARPEPRPAEPVASDFDCEWALYLAERAMERMKGSPYYDVLRRHLAGERQDRNKLWIARGKLVELVRDEVAFTCGSREEFEEEIAHLAPYLRPEKFRETQGGPPRS